MKPPAEKLIMQSLLDSGGGLGGLPDNLGDLFMKPHQDDNALIHTNSWDYINGDDTYNRRITQFAQSYALVVRLV